LLTRKEKPMPTRFASDPKNTADAEKYAEAIYNAVYDAVAKLVDCPDSAQEIADEAYKTAEFRARHPWVRLA
jgi:hypothetical protein